MRRQRVQQCKMNNKTLTPWLCRWRQYESPKRREPLIQRYGVTWVLLPSTFFYFVFLKTNILKIYTINLYIPRSALRQVNSPFRSQFSTECNLMFSLSISSNSSFYLWPYISCLRLLPCLSVTYIQPFIFPSITSSERSTYVTCDQSFWPSFV